MGMSNSEMVRCNGFRSCKPNLCEHYNEHRPQYDCGPLPCPFAAPGIAECVPVGKENEERTKPVSQVDEPKADKAAVIESVKYTMHRVRNDGGDIDDLIRVLDDLLAKAEGVDHE